MAQEGPGPRGGPGGPGGPGGGPRGGGNPVIAALDLDKDGVISADELAKASASLAALDKNKDGQLTADEFRPAPGGGGPGFGRVGNPEEFVARIMENDKNKDGKLTTDEIPDGMQGLLGRADADKD
ncbi:MAG: hypothetical protein EOP86_25900, partial [Verrucomicrobiaceae bacterium]